VFFERFLIVSWGVFLAVLCSHFLKFSCHLVESCSHLAESSFSSLFRRLRTHCWSWILARRGVTTCLNYEIEIFLNLSAFFAFFWIFLELNAHFRITKHSKVYVLTARSKGSGPDSVPLILKNCVPHLHCIFVAWSSLGKCIFPDRWKLSFVTPIFKSGRRNDISNYRGIAILSAIILDRVDSVNTGVVMDRTAGCHFLSILM
jgi:hypothetical protein